MSGGDYRNRPSFHIPGKEFLIVIVVVFSSLSFTLGYFVGKSRRDNGTVPPAPITETASPRNNSTDTYARPRPEEPAGTGRADPDRAATGDVGKVVAPRHSSSKGNSQRGTISYTVQIGAFSNEKDAEDLCAKYRGKRYTAYIVPAKNKRGETIYKIRIGEFKNRKDAELLSLKLKKTEELNTFVTFKDE